MFQAGRGLVGTSWCNSLSYKSFFQENNPVPVFWWVQWGVSQLFWLHLLPWRVRFHDEMMGTLKNSLGEALTSHRERKQLIKGHSFSAKEQDLWPLTSEASHSWLAFPDQFQEGFRGSRQGKWLGLNSHPFYQEEYKVSQQPHKSSIYPWNRGRDM